MSKEFKIRKCLKCGAMVKVLEDCTCKSDCGIKCCGEKMQELIPNTVDAAKEKHIPIYEIKDGIVNVTVNHVMEDDHYIEWVAIVKDNKERIKYFQPGEIIKTHCKYTPGLSIYSYCNKHGLWKIDVE